MGKATGVEMMKSFNIVKLFWRNKHSALGVALVICVVLLQQTSGAALYPCDGSSSSLGKKPCHFCQPATSSHSRPGNTGMGEGKSGHCKSNSKTSLHLHGVSSSKEPATSTKRNQSGNLFSIPQICCQIGKPEAEINYALISHPTLDIVKAPSAVIDSSRLSSPVSFQTISHQRSRPLYLFLSSFLI
jgi:hypothetical protein